MISVHLAVRQVIHQQAYLEDLLKDKLINLSALARHIKPQVEIIAKKPVTIGSIVMALKRISSQSNRSQQTLKLKRLVTDLNDIIVRSNLTELVYLNTNSLIQKQPEIIKLKTQNPYNFIALSQGLKETNIIVNFSLKDQVVQLLMGEELIYSYDHLAAVSLQLPPESTQVTGIYYHILKLLAFNDVNVFDVISTYTEFSLLVKQSELEKCLMILSNVRG